eukprot:CAMPEP_0204640006 /NCGR_PEP_ID=MMETSP0717-20131115/45216_1 /ASSEMBLY_ACC=CAM_ASM_000666 /TAXON_ID=230516 /ORGANISM="Chaetoceros curvisetus" /LENGTH=334 /DNA_ID=CAMNT_0051660283 /DNA_START=104 /DNA_END=1108 /DNA_ORIENTATION=-
MEVVIPPPEDKSAAESVVPLSSLKTIPPPDAESVASTASTLSAASTFEPYGTGVSEHINAASIQFAMMAENRSQALFRKILTPDELDAWDDIEREMNAYVREVQWFAEITKAKFKVIKDRVGNQNFASLSECYDGFDASEATARLSELKDQGAKIIKDVEKFRTRTENRLSGDRRRMLSTATKAVIGAVALTLIFFSPLGVEILITSIIASVGAGEVGFLAFVATELTAVGAVGGLSGLAAYEGINAQVLKNRTNKAIAYLREIEGNLEKLIKSLAKVHACTKAFTVLGEKDDRALIQSTITGIIEQLDELIAVGDEAIASGKTKEEGWWCTVM